MPPHESVRRLGSVLEASLLQGEWWVGVPNSYSEWPVDRVVKDGNGAQWRLLHIGTEGPAVHLGPAATSASLTMDIYEARPKSDADAVPRTIHVPRAWDLDDLYVQEHCLSVELLSNFE